MGFNLKKTLKKVTNAVLPGAWDVGEKLADGLKGAWDDYTGKTAVEKQNEYNMEMWKLQNEYNTPANQMKRYLEAGLNPNLIYSQGNAGNASSAPEMTAHQGSFAKALGLAQLVLQVKNMSAQNRNLNAQTSNIDAQTKQHLADVEYKTAMLDFYEKNGYFPNQMNSPVNVVKELVNNSPVKTATEGVGRWLGDVAGAAVGKFTTSNEYSGRGKDLAIKAADRKGLSGRERSEYIEKFLKVYDLTH